MRLAHCIARPPAARPRRALHTRPARCSPARRTAISKIAVHTPPTHIAFVPFTVSFGRRHLLWIIPLVVLAAVGGAWWWLVDSLTYGNAQPLHRAVMHQDAEKVRSLLARGADVNARMHADLSPNTWNATPLHLAAARNDTPIMQLLLENGADKEACDKRGATPLHRALQQGADNAAQILINARASVRIDEANDANARQLELNGQPIQMALRHASVQTVRVLVQAGADPWRDIGADAMQHAEEPDKLEKLRFLAELGFSPRMNLILIEAAERNQTEVVAFLLDHGAKIDGVDVPTNLTALLGASLRGANDTVKLLLDRGADPHVGTPIYGSAIYAATFGGHRETVHLLLSRNLNIDLQRGRASDRATPLHMAYWHNDAAMIQLLLAAGASPKALTTDGRSPEQFRR